jgi:hypothetical protein
MDLSFVLRYVIWPVSFYGTEQRSIGLLVSHYPLFLIAAFAPSQRIDMALFRSIPKIRAIFWSLVTSLALSSAMYQPHNGTASITHYDLSTSGPPACGCVTNMTKYSMAAMNQNAFGATSNAGKVVVKAREKGAQ